VILVIAITRPFSDVTSHNEPITVYLEPAVRDTLPPKATQIIKPKPQELLRREKEKPFPITPVPQVQSAEKKKEDLHEQTNPNQLANNLSTRGTSTVSEGVSAGNPGLSGIDEGHTRDLTRPVSVTVKSPSTSPAGALYPSPSRTEGRQDTRDYVRGQFTYIRSLIVKNIAYPSEARRRGREGTLTLGFVILENGSVTDIHIVESSGSDVLDKAAVNAIRRTEPFPKPPARAELIIPITFKLG
jgi:periplasmic protein TonB